MKLRNGIAAAAFAAVAGLMTANVMAQSGGQPPPPAQDNAPAANPAAPGGGNGPGFGRGPRMGREGGGWGGGPGYGMRGRGDFSQGMSEADRTAFFESRLAAIRAGLMLNETQQRLWPAVEAAIRESRKQREELRERMRKEGQSANPADRMKRAGEIMTARGAMMTRMADAMKPFHDSLTDDQKRRMQTLMRGGQGFGQRHGMHRRNGDAAPGAGRRGEFQQSWGQHHGEGRQGDGRQGRGFGDDRSPRWRQNNAPDGDSGREDWRRM